MVWLGLERQPIQPRLLAQLQHDFRQRLARIDDLARSETGRLAASLDQVATVGQDKGAGARDEQLAVAGREAAQVAPIDRRAHE